MRTRATYTILPQKGNYCLSVYWIIFERTYVPLMMLDEMKVKVEVKVKVKVEVVKINIQ